MLDDFNQGLKHIFVCVCVGLFFLMSLFSGFQLVEGGSHEGNATDARVLAHLLR